MGCSAQAHVQAHREAEHTEDRSPAMVKPGHLASLAACCLAVLIFSVTLADAGVIGLAAAPEREFGGMHLLAVHNFTRAEAASELLESYIAVNVAE